MVVEKNKCQMKFCKDFKNAISFFFYRRPNDDPDYYSNSRLPRPPATLAVPVFPQPSRLPERALLLAAATATNLRSVVCKSSN